MRFELAYSGVRGVDAPSPPLGFVRTRGTYQSISMLASGLNEHQDTDSARVITYYPTPCKEE